MQNYMDIIFQIYKFLMVLILSFLILAYFFKKLLKKRQIPHKTPDFFSKIYIKENMLVISKERLYHI